MHGARIAIIDAGKASVVMTSEVFKEKLPGAVISVLQSGKDAIKHFETEQPHLAVVDFDLPDTDGISLILNLRQKFAGPLLLTAYPDPIVEQAVKEDLFAFNDAGTWIAKPVKPPELAKLIERFLIENKRLEKRFPVQIPTTLVGKGAGRGKRAPRSGGKTQNMSFSGVKLAVESVFDMKLGDELSLTLNIPENCETLKKADHSQPNSQEIKLKTKVAWFDSQSKTVGLRFSKLSEHQRKDLGRLLKSSQDLPQ